MHFLVMHFIKAHQHAKITSEPYHARNFETADRAPRDGMTQKILCFLREGYPGFTSVMAFCLIFLDIW